MSLLPLSPFLAAALLCVAVTVPPEASAAMPGLAAAPTVHRTTADTGWQRYLLVGPGPVFRHANQPMRG